MLTAATINYLRHKQTNGQTPGIDFDAF